MDTLKIFKITHVMHAKVHALNALSTPLIARSVRLGINIVKFQMTFVGVVMHITLMPLLMTASPAIHYAVNAKPRAPRVLNASPLKEFSILSIQHLAFARRSIFIIKQRWPALNAIPYAKHARMKQTIALLAIVKSLDMLNLMGMLASAALNMSITKHQRSVNYVLPALSMKMRNVFHAFLYAILALNKALTARRVKMDWALLKWDPISVYVMTHIFTIQLHLAVTPALAYVQNAPCSMITVANAKLIVQL